MIRFIIKRHERDNNAGSETISYQTLDVDLPELQKILDGGGRGEMGFESFQLVGTEIIREQATGCRGIGGLEHRFAKSEFSDSWFCSKCGEPQGADHG